MLPPAASAKSSLLDHVADARFVFVAGKGGVGKTTTAGAVALALADRSVETHLISTDPAHSLGDLFARSFGASSVILSGCAPTLVLEQLDSVARARTWAEEAIGPVTELFDLGTYLDAEDVHPFLDVALPGMDEVMGAVRLAELHRTGPDRIVVDTAPTGHFLRLLESGRVLATWAHALDAMARKAGAVRVQLAGQGIRLAGEAFMAQIRRDVETFERQVLSTAAFLVVSRPAEVVQEETVRLVHALTERGLRVAAEVSIGGKARPQAAPVVVAIPETVGLGGCSGLRRWGETRAEDTGRSSSPTLSLRPAAKSDSDALAEALSRPLLLFAGKGGVGKSTCASACAVRLSRSRRVLLLSADPAGSLGEVLPDVALDQAEGARLTVRQVEADREYARFRARYRDEIAEVAERLGLVRAAVMDRRVLEALLQLAPPGIDEMFAVHTMMREWGSYDTIVLDTAPTGHFLRLLELPDIAYEWTRGAMRILLKYRSVLGLDAFAEGLLLFARDLRRLGDMLRDPSRTGILVVTDHSTLAAPETSRLLHRLGVRAAPVAAVIHNRVRADARPEVGGSLPDGPMAISAPLMPRSPVGTIALDRFFESWILQEPV